MPSITHFQHGVARTALAATLAFGFGAAAAPALAEGRCLPSSWIRTQVYWGNAPGLAWPDAHDRSTRFFRSELTWQEVLDSPAHGDAYLSLAQQYIAAALNVASGSAAPRSLRALLVAVGRWLENATPGMCMRGACPLQRSWARVLDEYNNGEYPGAPKRCEPQA